MQAAPPLLLSNSLGTSLEMWEPQMRGARGPLPCDPLRQPRPWAVGGDAGPYTIEQLASDALGLLDEL